MEQAIENTIGQAGVAPEATAGGTAPDLPAPGSAPLQQETSRKQRYAGREWSADHALNIRISVPLGVGRYYITLVAGKERRARARLALDRRQNPLDTPGNVAFLAFIATIATAGSVTLFYLAMAHLFGWSGRLIP